ncbi:bifunctional copper resistance protein CopD/cytochrome c oxidase assembly protein [Kocuria sp. LUK]|uniref:Copper resistance protein CopD n=1 Tax=Kocuria flava TaxID=446860 RepID=A0A2N4T1K4_9MICC|nr:MULTISPECIES: cytochrome c oxidase assembly protein [Kocuria]MCD1146086.1 bifunctional copper resistance protein CopD/cytochrome c oxidase assembly protein [Kocuria sp. LUK]PLC12093.1 copper resistance protein CopD [Kocuria flava]
MTSRTVQRTDRGTGPQETGTRGTGGRRPEPWTLAAVPVVALTALVLAMLWSGSGAPRLAADPGALVRWGLPVAEVVHDGALVVVLGSLLFALGIVPKHRGTGRRRGTGQDPAPEHPLFTQTLRLGGAAAVVWTVAAVAVLVLSYSDVAGVPVGGDETYTGQLVHYATEIPTGQAQSVIVVVAAVVTTLLFGVRALLGLLLTAGLACTALVAMALNGHSAGGNDHMGAVNSLGLHLLGVCLWTGGLVVLAWLAPWLDAPEAGTAALPAGSARGRTGGAVRRVPLAAVVLRRFSAVALAAFLLVAASGVVNSAVRIGSWEQLFSPYGEIALTKAVLTLLLGAAGLVHRRRLIPGLEAGRIGPRRAVWQLVLGELLVMGAVMGLAVALSRTAPPVPETIAPDASPALILTWYELPPEPTAASWFTTWRVDWLWLTVCLVLLVVYLRAMVRVRRRGDAWSVLRALSWVTGLGVLFWITSGGPAVYGRVLFSAHMVEHMMLTMVVPIFLVLGAPVTLLLKALEPRQDGSRGPREWILRLVHSTWSRVVTHPVFAAVNFAASIVVFYFTPLFGLTLRYHVGHVFMVTHFLITGYLFMLVLIGTDPIPRRPGHMMRLVLLLATMVYHAFVGVALMGSDTLLQASWFGNTGRDWGRTAIEDQQFGGALMWGIGEFPTVVVAVVVAVLWAIEGTKENRRADRKADRTDDAELKAYNEMMAGLAEHDDRAARR